VLLIPPNCPHQENRVEHYPANNDGQQNQAEEEQNARAPIENNPANVEEKTYCDQSRAEGDKEGDRFVSACYDHESSICCADSDRDVALCGF
jgi:hypothetical protein